MALERAEHGRGAMRCTRRVAFGDPSAVDALHVAARRGDDPEAPLAGSPHG
jgi:hypothetical protein